MIQRHGNLDFGVVVTDANGQPLPAVVHEGVTYIVCTAGQEFQVQVSCKTLQHWDPSQSYQVNLTVDGKSCGYSYTLEMQHPTSNFNGWWLDHKSKRAFVFTAPSEVRGDSQGATKKPELGSLKAIFAEAEEYPCPASGGAECSECDFLGHGTKTVTKAVPEEAAALKQADEKKFFLQPSLGAKAGARLDQKPHAKKSFHRREKLGGKTYTLKLHFEAAPILQLRKILVPSNPTHAQIIAASSNARQQAARDSLAGPKGQAGGPDSMAQARVIKKESKVVKNKMGQSLKSTVIETVDLTEDVGDDQDCMMYTVAKRPKLEGVMLQID